MKIILLAYLVIRSDLSSPILSNKYIAKDILVQSKWLKNQCPFLSCSTKVDFFFNQKIYSGKVRELCINVLLSTIQIHCI